MLSLATEVFISSKVKKFVRENIGETVETTGVVVVTTALVHEST